MMSWIDVVIGVFSGSMSIGAAFFWILQQWLSAAQ